MVIACLVTELCDFQTRNVTSPFPRRFWPEPGGSVRFGSVRSRPSGADSGGSEVCFPVFLSSLTRTPTPTRQLCLSDVGRRPSGPVHIQRGWITFVFRCPFTICVLLTANFERRAVQPIRVTACVSAESASNRVRVAGRGLRSEGGDTGGGAEPRICQRRLSVVARCRADTALIMFQNNGEKWGNHGVRLPSTPTEIWTGRRNAAAF